MNDTTSSPSRLLKITAVTARWVLGLLIAAWLLFGLSVAVLHGWIVPRIDQYRGALEAQATRAIGVPVRIGAISADSSALFPSFELRDVSLLDAQQHEALRLARVVASVSPRSLWRLSFEQLYLERLEVEVRRDAQGKLHVAGLDMGSETSGESRGADWFFSQRELVVENGTVRWTDEQRGAPALVLTDVRFVARNSARTHRLRLDATPPTGWGQRFSLRGEFRQPLLSVRSGNWKSWDGQLYAELPRIDVTRLDRYLDLDARIREGHGGLRLWADVQDGQAIGGVADLALDRVDVQLERALQPLVLSEVTGRLAGRQSEGSQEFATHQLQFQTDDGVRWPGGNLQFSRALARGRMPERGSLRADRLDLGVLALIANRLPLGHATHRLLATYAPRGLVERLDTSWQGDVGAPERYQLRGRVSALTIAAQPAEAAAAPRTAGAVAVPLHPGRPGVRGASVEFDANQSGGSATLSIAQGALEFPGVFEEPSIALDQLSTQVLWKLDGAQVQLTLNDLRFANADAQGVARAVWRTSDPALSSGRSRFPGVLDLSGTLSRADGARVHRYLPLDIPRHTREYVRDSVHKGASSAVEFRVRGDLHDMPFTDPRLGDFRISARVSDVTYQYVPHDPAAPAGASAWPALVGASGELVFERAGMQVRHVRARLAGAPGIELARGSAQIADMGHHAPVLRVDAQARGPLAELLQAGAPLLGEARAFATQVRATGDADYRLALELPLEAMDKFKLQAAVALAGNELRLQPGLPPFQQARGSLQFTETGFQLAGVQARLAGGEARMEGRGKWGATGLPEMNFTAQGSVSAEGLRATPELGEFTRLAGRMQGTAAYGATWALKDGAPEFSLGSSLQGMALQLPAPLSKSADQAMPLRISQRVSQRAPRRAGEPGAPLQEQLQVELGSVARALYVHDLSGPQARVLRGSIGIGLDEAPPLPERGVRAAARLGQVDLDAWRALFSQGAGQPAPALTADADADGGGAYMPSTLAVHAQQLTVAGRTLHQVVLGGTRDAGTWRVNLDATEMSGYAEYRQAQGGRLYARLSRLRIARGDATQVESLLDEQPDTLPALDVVVDDFELFGRRLGRAEVVAVNRGGPGREWRLDKLSLAMPEASFSAQGAWAAERDAARAELRRTEIKFTLDMQDAGALLGRLGMKDVLARGRGRLEGEVSWRGSPLTLDYPSMDGQLHVDVASGQFLKADPGLAKLLGVLSLQALPRRLTLDFRDVFSQGFAFDFVRGDATIRRGVASTNNLQMKGPNAAALMSGSADIARETQDLNVVVAPELNAGTAALVATAIHPAIGLGTFLAQMVLRRPLIAATTQEFQIDGTWADPRITKVARKLVPNAPPVAEEAKDGKEIRQ